MGTSTDIADTNACSQPVQGYRRRLALAVALESFLVSRLSWLLKSRNSGNGLRLTCMIIWVYMLLRWHQSHIQPADSDQKTLNALQELKNNSNTIASEAEWHHLGHEKRFVVWQLSVIRVNCLLRLQKSYPGINMLVGRDCNRSSAALQAFICTVYYRRQSPMHSGIVGGNRLLLKMISNMRWKVTVEDERGSMD